MQSRRGRGGFKGSNGRKRRYENGDSGSGSRTDDGPLLLDDPVMPDTKEMTVDKDKVFTFLKKIAGDSERVSENRCLRLVVLDSEAIYLNTDMQEEIHHHLGTSTISISDPSPYSIDRIITIYGNSNQVACAGVFIGYVLTSDFNNLLKKEPFTLKSQNYKVDVLMEVDDYELDDFVNKNGLSYFDHAEYDNNIDLSLATVKGDLSYMFRCLLLVVETYPFKHIVSEKDINITPVINVHDGDYLRPKPDVETTRKEKESLINHVYTQQFAS